MYQSSHFNLIRFFLILLLCCFTYSITSPITVDTVYAKREEKQERNEEKQKRRAEKRRRQEEKEGRNKSQAGQEKSQEERDKDQDRRIKQLESGQKKSGIIGWLKSAASKVPVIGPILDIPIDLLDLVIPSAICENNCGAENLPRSDSHAWTCKDKGHDSPVVVWMCSEATMECPKASEHFNCSGQNAHNRNTVSGSDGNKNPDCTICWGSGACSVCDNTD